MSSAALEITMPGDCELVMTRLFEAPRHLVYRALTEPALLRRWYGAHGWSLVVCEMDLRVGGAWRYVTRRPDGREIGQRGVYREITPPSRIVHSESWEDWNPGELLVTTTLTERDGQTTFACSMRFPTRDVRDLLIQHGMTSGAAETYDRLAECLTSIT